MSNETFTVYMYKQEKSYLEWLVLQRKNIETGGDLFGLWRSSDTAIVQLLIGPGQYCNRTATSFYQDVNYLANVGEKLTSSQGLCNIGEWHSHHRIDLPTPSAGDQATVWRHVDSVSGGRFLLFIASITGSNTNAKVNIGCFMFSTSTRIMTKGSLVPLRGGSPIRGQLKNVSLNSSSEIGADWGSFLKEYKPSSFDERNSGQTKSNSESVHIGKHNEGASEQVKAKGRKTPSSAASPIISKNSQETHGNEPKSGSNRGWKELPFDKINLAHEESNLRSQQKVHQNETLPKNTMKKQKITTESTVNPIAARNLHDAKQNETTSAGKLDKTTPKTEVGNAKTTLKSTIQKKHYGSTGDGVISTQPRSMRDITSSKLQSDMKDRNTSTWVWRKFACCKLCGCECCSKYYERNKLEEECSQGYSNL